MNVKGNKKIITKFVVATTLFTTAGVVAPVVGSFLFTPLRRILLRIIPQSVLLHFGNIR